MITNERQYSITRGQLRRFENLARELRAAPPEEPGDLRRELEVATVEAQVTELRGQLEEYDGLKSGRVAVGPLKSLDQLPDLLTRARIARGLTQGELAQLVGLKEQQIQRYESTRWSGASLSRLIEIATALDLEIGPDQQMDSSTQTTQLGDVLQRVEQAGVHSEFIRRRILPVGSDDVTTVLGFAARLNRVFEWTPAAILAGEIEPLGARTAIGASYKLPARASESRVAAYTTYSYYLAQVTLDATDYIPSSPLPSSAAEFRDSLIRRSGGVDFRSALSFAWDSGIPVLPLAEPGGFHAIVWRSSGRNVIVLKQQNRSPSRWLFDLLHELCHTTDSPENPSFVVVDDDQTGQTENEERANQFAGDVLLDGQAEALVQECVDQASERIEYLKNAVRIVAHRRNVDAGALANYLAHRLSMQGENWWGAAANMQSSEYDPWHHAREEFFARANFQSLAPIDAELLAQALTD